jgi:hypothetical protein
MEFWIINISVPNISMVVVANCLLINSRCRNPRAQCRNENSKIRFWRRDSDLDRDRPLFDDIDAEINDREY